MLLSTKIVIGAACLTVAGFGSFRVTAWAGRGPTRHRHSSFKAIDLADPLYPCSIRAERHLRACFEIQTSVIRHLNRGNIGAAAHT